MATADKKRKWDVLAPNDDSSLAVRLDMLSKDEIHRSSLEDDEFLPLLNIESDSENENEPADSDDAREEDEEEDGGGGGEEDGEEEEEEEEDEEEDHGETNSGPSEDKNGLRLGPQHIMVISRITGQPKRVYPHIEPDYDSDSSTEDSPNRVGNIPMHWYDGLPHVGYNLNGKKVLRPARGDELDKFLQTVEDPSSWTTALDRNTDSEKPLTAEELDLIRRLRENEIPDPTFDPYEVFLSDQKAELMPISGAPEPKRRWVPSKWEKQKVMKIVRAIRQGRILPAKPKSASGVHQFYSLWSTPTDSTAPAPQAAPKTRLPTHAESYNPPPEYLPDPDASLVERRENKRSFTPKSHSALRLVPGYDRFINERFDRLLDLYLAPRVQRRRLPPGVNKADDLIPQLPDPQTLHPFPTYRALCHSHKTRVRAISVSPGGEWVVSADEIGEVRLWEVLVGRELKSWSLGGKVCALDWCPRKDVTFFVVGIDDNLHMFMPPSLQPAMQSATLALLGPSAVQPPLLTSSPVKWTSSETDIAGGPILSIHLPPSTGSPKQVTWHRRGDYFASVSGTEGQGSVWIHQLSKRHSQAPFRKIRGSVQRVLFHPHKPHFFVATQRYVRVYDLAAQQLLKTLMPGLRWISSMDVHPSGDHLIVGGYDRKLCWFDLELSEKPYKVLRYHTRALRSLEFHPSYPLFASTSDDGTIQVFHARVFSDLLTDPLIVPLKILRGHTVNDGLGVLEARWCPGAPWLVTAGADGVVNVWL